MSRLYMCANRTQRETIKLMHDGGTVKIIISDGEAIDIASIMPIMNSAFDPQYGEAWNSAQCLSMLAMPYTDLYIAQYEQQICGFAFTRSLYEEVELLMIATHSDYARIGVATSLMKHIIKVAKKQSRERIFLEMRQGNGAETLYDYFDFENISERKNYYKGRGNIHYNAVTKQLLI